MLFALTYNLKLFLPQSGFLISFPTQLPKQSSEELGVRFFHSNIFSFSFFRCLFQFQNAKKILKIIMQNIIESSYLVIFYAFREWLWFITVESKNWKIKLHAFSHDFLKKTYDNLLCYSNCSNVVLLFQAEHLFPPNLDDIISLLNIFGIHMLCLNFGIYNINYNLHTKMQNAHLDKCSIIINTP